MRANLIQLLTRNWPIKGAAVFLALMLYVAVQLQQPVTTSFDVVLNVLMPPGRALVHKPPKVRVQISGKGSQILKLRSLAGDITRRVPDTLTASTWSVRLEPTDVELALPKGADVRVIEIRPSEITLALDSVVRKDVRIVPLVTVTPDSGQFLRGGLSIAPTVARLAGRAGEEPRRDRVGHDDPDGDHQRLRAVHPQRPDRHDAARHRAPGAEAGHGDRRHGHARRAVVRGNSGRDGRGRDHELSRDPAPRRGTPARATPDSVPLRRRPGRAPTRRG